MATPFPDNPDRSKPAKDQPGSRERLSRRPSTTKRLRTWTGEGWLYVSAVIDLLSRRVVGWSMERRHDVVWPRGKPDALLHHSD
jgi:transposase InsO family protein